MRRIGAALRHLRLQRGLTQKEIEIRAQIARTTLSRMENGALDPKMSTVDRVLDAAGYGVEDLMTTLLWLDQGKSEAPATPLERVTVSFEVPLRPERPGDLEKIQQVAQGLQKLLA